ncbi:MAG TPA: hypothetical protein VK897_01600 [Anaerolineales bacterium]|nr:hypothetical protein [Anaerolineales bacterium]
MRFDGMGKRPNTASRTITGIIMHPGKGRRGATQPDPRKSTGAIVVRLLPRFGGGSVRTPYGQSGSLRGSELVPAKWHSLVPPTSG